MLERLESLPFDGLLDWRAALQLWQYHRDTIEPPLDPPREGGEGEVRPEKVGSSVGASDGEEGKKESVKIPSECAERENETETTEKTSENEGKKLCSSLLKKESITFRVTCTRSGRKHSFSSPDAAKLFGAGLAVYFGWKVKLKDSDIEVLLRIHGDEVRVGVALNREAKFKRNIAHFGPTTLRATIGYGMLR